jgi:hypothetical protein
MNDLPDPFIIFGVLFIIMLGFVFDYASFDKRMPKNLYRNKRDFVIRGGLPILLVSIAIFILYISRGKV